MYSIARLKLLLYVTTVLETNRSIEKCASAQRAVVRAKETIIIRKHITKPNEDLPTNSDQTEQSSSPSAPGSNSHINISNQIIPSNESEDSVLDDDGLREPEQFHHASVNGLRLIVMFWR